MFIHTHTMTCKNATFVRCWHLAFQPISTASLSCWSFSNDFDRQLDALQEIRIAHIGVVESIVNDSD